MQRGEEQKMRQEAQCLTDELNDDDKLNSTQTFYFEINKYLQQHKLYINTLEFLQRLFSRLEQVDL